MDSGIDYSVELEVHLDESGRIDWERIRVDSAYFRAVGIARTKYLENQ